jgi:hypothetical protein
MKISELIKEVKRLCVENPQNIYSNNGQCFYTLGENDCGTGCLFGQALINIEPDYKESLASFDNEVKSLLSCNGSLGWGISQVIDALEIENDIDFDLSVLEEIQEDQDNHYKWGSFIERL